MIQEALIHRRLLDKVMNVSGCKRPVSQKRCPFLKAPAAQLRAAHVMKGRLTAGSHIKECTTATELCSNL